MIFYDPDQDCSGLENWRPEELLFAVLGLKGDESPFPWQRRLLELFLQGKIPDACDIPTGLGKTSVMDIWLVARIFGAPIPRRLVYVVDRRAVVDQATESAQKLRAFLEDHRELKERLGLEDMPLPISTLRGQYVDNREWLGNPAWPGIIVGTVDMIGSRLLFEGYGVSRKMRPYHAGLLGVDTLLVLDEAHLVPPFEHLLRSIASDPTFRPREERYEDSVPSFRLLTLSATGRRSASAVISLEESDYQHPIVRKRLQADKFLQLIQLEKDDKLEDKLAEHAWELSEEGRQPRRIVVFSDSRDVAQKAKDLLKKMAGSDRKGRTQGKKIQTELLVGERRVFEREAARQRLATMGFVAGSVAHPISWTVF